MKSFFTYAYLMPLLKKQIERLQLIHELLQGGGEYSANELVAKVNSMLNIGISRRTLISDMNYLRSKGAPLAARMHKYKYLKPFSFKYLLGEIDANLLINEEVAEKIATSPMDNNSLELFFNLFPFDKTEKKALKHLSRVLNFDLNWQNLENSEFLPLIFEYIQKKQVIELTYVDFAKKKVQDIFHPYLLKEYNGRWYVFGLSENDQKKHEKIRIFQYAVDRIRKLKVADSAKVKYLPNDWWEVNEHFRDMVGVTKYEDKTAQKVIVRVYGATADYLLTKKIHHSQTVIQDEEEFLDVSFFLIDNYEFRSKILALGPNAEILEPEYLREEFQKTIEKMVELYQSNKK